MIRIATLALFAAVPASAEPRGAFDVSEVLPEVFFVPGHGDTPDRVVHHNQNRAAGEIGAHMLTLETPFGAIVLEHVVTTNNDCVPGCPDTLEVIEVPEGYVVTPMFVVTPERGRSEMVIAPYLGG